MPLLCAPWLFGGPALDKAIAIKPADNLDYGMEIWAHDLGHKVLNIEWDRNGCIDLVSFRRGEWEKRVLAFEMIDEGEEV